MFNSYEYNRENCNCSESCACVSCEEVLREYHELIKEVQCLNRLADNIVSEVLCNVLNSLRDLEKAIKLKMEANQLNKKANCILNNSDCCFDCNKDSRCCEALKERAECFYNLENKEIIEAMRRLKEVVCNLKRALYYGEQGDKIEAKYIKCVHTQKYDHC